MSNPSVGDKARYAAERVMEPILRRWFAIDLDPIDVERNAENAAVDLSWALESAGLLLPIELVVPKIAGEAPTRKDGGPGDVSGTGSQPSPAACPHGDPYCPCQDGDSCHYEDTPTVKAMGCSTPNCPACASAAQAQERVPTGVVTWEGERWRVTGVGGPWRDDGRRRAWLVPLSDTPHEEGAEQ